MQMHAHGHEHVHVHGLLCGQCKDGTTPHLGSLGLPIDLGEYFHGGAVRPLANALVATLPDAIPVRLRLVKEALLPAPIIS